MDCINKDITYAYYFNLTTFVDSIFYQEHSQP